MQLDEIFEDLDIDVVARYSVNVGEFDTISFCTKFAFPKSDFYRSPMDSRVLKTVLHETVHLYQSISTPYGYYYYNLRQLQAFSILEILRLLRQHGARFKRFPLIKVFSTFPRRSYPDVWYFLDLWQLIEVNLLYLEGNTDKITSIFQSNRSARNKVLPFSIFLSILERHLISLFPNLYPDIQAREITIDRFNKDDETRLSVLKILGNLDAMDLLESWAKVAEFWPIVSGNPKDILPSKIPSELTKYYGIIHLATNSLKCRSIREFVLTFTAICELCLYSPILPEYANISRSETNVRAIHPLLRFVDALQVASRINPITDLQRDYETFITTICDNLQWPTPSSLAKRTIEHKGVGQNDLFLRLFTQAQEFKIRTPWFLIDLEVWNSASSSADPLFYDLFTPSIVEFSDTTLYHPKKNILDYFLVNYFLNTYLRRMLLSDDLTIIAPFRLKDEHLMYYSVIISDQVYNSTGLRFMIHLV